MDIVVILKIVKLLVSNSMLYISFVMSLIRALLRPKSKEGDEDDFTYNFVEVEVISLKLMVN